MVSGRSKQVLKAWLAARPQAWRQGIEPVAMDGLTGVPGPPPARSWLRPGRCAAPFHVVRLAGDALDSWRRRVQQQLHGRPGARW
ncbi:transposase [Actinomyces respiraculi]|uniref:transposase n=1 Tax=Actinomyces respiraculi TaxID=2744574 RepID=UPI0039A52531